MILEPGLAFKEMMISINAARIYVAAMCCGMVEDCIEVVRNYGNDRHAFGMPLNQHQGWRWTIANARVELAAATALVAQAAKLIDCGGDAQILAAKAKIFATQMASRQVAELMHKMGAEGLSTDQPFARHLLAAQAASLVDGSTEILLERISRGV
jgi:alkylation response protein AidB-like acyl-CoA dehydrogenase